MESSFWGWKNRTLHRTAVGERGRGSTSRSPEPTAPTQGSRSEQEMSWESREGAEAGASLQPPSCTNTHFPCTEWAP